MASATSIGFAFPHTLTEALQPLLGHLDDETLIMLDSLLVERDQAVEDALTYTVVAPPAGGGGSSAGATASGTVVSETSYGQAPAVGTSPDYARGDHTHGTPASTSVSPATSVVTETGYGQASAVGTGVKYAREDHTHGTPADPTAAITAAYQAADLFERKRRLMLVP